MKNVSIECFIEGLKEIPKDEFHCQPVYEYMASQEIDMNSVERFLHWSDRFYTRNLIFKNERFEVMALCWEIGQASTIHDHADQMCWMMVPTGKLRGRNFNLLEFDKARKHSRLEHAESFDLSDCLAATVELEKPIHQILNLAEFDERAVSIHIYSKPFKTCLTFCDETDTFKEVSLVYTSIDGVLQDGINL
ncbi:MAG: cysteine dioxygenase [Pyrinomonadaceae bacterium]